MKKIICLGLVACTGLQCPLKLYVMMLDGIKNNRIVVTDFQLWSLTQPALKLRSSWDSQSASIIDVTCSLALSFTDPSGLECVVWCCWLKNAVGNLSSV